MERLKLAGFSLRTWTVLSIMVIVGLTLAAPGEMTASENTSDGMTPDEKNDIIKGMEDVADGIMPQQHYPR